MSNVLNEICAVKREHVQAQEAKVPLAELLETIKTQEPPRGFINALKNAQAPAIIAEIKKASPSKGIIREDFDPKVIAQIYESNGATCLSVLTDEPYFQGHDTYLKQAKDRVKLPVLRKDFMISPYQIYESRALGADCILLIVAALDDTILRQLYDLSTNLGMDVLVEVHNQEELERALKINPAMVGINNRNLKTLTVDIQTSFALKDMIPDTCIAVAESGLSKAETIKSLDIAGFNAYLVGESLMRQKDIGLALRTLREH